MVTALDLRESMRDNGFEHREPVAHTTRRSRKVDHEGLPRHAADSPGQHGRWDPCLHTGCTDGLGNPGDKSVHDPLGGLRGAVVRGQASATSGHHQRGARGDGIAKGHLDIGTIGNHDDVAHRKPPASQGVDDDGPRTVRIDPGGRPGRAGDHHGGSGHDQSRAGHDSTQSPDLPPDLAVTCTSVIRACLSTALTMSISAKAPTDTAVSASISTPVRSAVRTVAVRFTPSSMTTRSTSTPWTPIGWARGIRSGVRLAAWIAAIRATDSASPLGTVPPRSAATAAAESRTRPTAVAERTVTSLAETSTMCADPSARTCVRRGSLMTPPRSAPAGGKARGRPP